MKHFLFVCLIGSVLLTVSLGMSRSRSCTMVNGKMRCQESSDPSGNVAAAAAGARIGGGEPAFTFEHAATGNTREDSYNSHYSSSGGDSSPDSSEPSSSETNPPYSGGSDVFDPVAPETPEPVDTGFPFGSPGRSFGVFSGASSSRFPGTSAFAGTGFGGFGSGGVGAFAGAGSFGLGFPFSPFGTGAMAYAGRRKR